MSLVIEKYIAYNLVIENEGKRYEKGDFRGNGSIDLYYLWVVLDQMKINDVLFHLQQPDGQGYGNDSVSLDVVCEKGVKYIEITYLDIVDWNTDYDCHYVIRCEDFLDVVKRYQECLNHNVSTVYLVLLQGGKIVLLNQLADNNFILPKKWLEYINIAYIETRSRYERIEITSSSLRWLYSLHFHLGSYKEMFSQYEVLKNNGKIPSSITIDIFREVVDSWKVLKDKKVPEIYFILEDDGSIAVRESLN